MTLEEKKAHLKAYKAAYYKANILKHKALAAAWRAANREQLRKDKAAWHVKHYKANQAKEVKRQAIYRETHREIVRARNRAWARANYAKDPIAGAARAAAWRAAHPARIKTILSTYRKRHPEKTREKGLRQNARRRGAAGRATAAQIQARVDLYGGRCAYCERSYEHIDHVIPLAKGGSNWPSNLVPACAKCNHRKKDKTLATLGWKRRFSPT